MSSWDDRFRNHQIWTELNTLETVVNDSISRNNPETTESLNRIRVVSSTIRARLTMVDPQTIAMSSLSGMLKSIRGAHAELSSFLSGNSPGHVETANSHIDTALTVLAQLYVPTTVEDYEALKQAAINYRATLDEQTCKATQMTTEIDSLRNAIAIEQEALRKLISDFQGQFSEAQERRNRDFVAIESARQEKASAVISDAEEKFAGYQTLFTAQSESLNKDFTISANKVLEVMEEKKAQVEKLVGVIGNLGVTSGYQKTADYARERLWFWQKIAIASMIGVIAAGGYAFVLFQGTFSWEMFAARLVLCLAIGVLAAYAAAQADRFFEMERRNRKMALELEAIGPYLAPLPQEQQDKFRIEIGDRSFGRGEAAIGRRTARSPATLLDVILKNKESRELLNGLLKEILKRLKG